MSPQHDRMVRRFSSPGIIVTTRKIAARVSGATTGCGIAPAPANALGAVMSVVLPARNALRDFGRVRDGGTRVARSCIAECVVMK